MAAAHVRTRSPETRIGRRECEAVQKIGLLSIHVERLRLLIACVEASQRGSTRTAPALVPSAGDHRAPP